MRGFPPVIKGNYRISPVQRTQYGLALIHVNSNSGNSDKNKVAASLRIPVMNTNQQGLVPFR